MNINKNDSYKALLQHSQENCDFCNRVFRNKFECIVHNASHIIIPLIKQNCLKCIDCHRYFVSLDDLIEHRGSEHTLTTKDHNITYTKELPLSEYEIEIKNHIEINNIENKESQNNIEIIDSKLKTTEKRNNCKETDNYTKVKKVSHNKIKKKCYDVELENYNKYDEHYENLTNKIQHNSVKEEVKPDLELCSYNGTISINNSKSIVSRLKFEDDDGLESGTLIHDLLTECKVHVQNTPWIGLSGDKKLTKPESIEYDNKIDLFIDNNLEKSDTLVKNKVVEYRMIEKLNDVCENILLDEYKYDNFIGSKVRNIKDRRYKPLIIKYESVHYLNLLKPGIFNCRYCTESYPNQFSLIQHEPKHIKIKKPRPLLCTFCDRYIAGNYINLHRHIELYHPTGNITKKHDTHNCIRCGLKFRKYIWHVRNYHRLDCPRCGKEFTHHEELESEKHREACNLPEYQSSKIFNACDLCYSFFKQTMNHKYMILNTVNELGVRYPCSRCGKKYFEIKRVKLINMVKREFHFKEKKPITNEDRLKRLQHKLKKINFLNKFYSIVSFYS